MAEQNHQNHQTRRDFLTAFIWGTIGLIAGCLMPRKCQQQIRPIETAWSVEVPDDSEAVGWQYTRTFKVTPATEYEQIKALNDAIRERYAIATDPLRIEYVYNVKRTNKAPGYTFELISMKAVGDND